AGIRMARTPRRGARATERLQPGDRLLRGCLTRGWPRRARDRGDPVIGVLVSGEGTNLQALIDAGLPIVAVASNNTKARALDRAVRAGIDAAAVPTVEFEGREERDLAMAGFLEERGVRWTVCAGYMNLLTKPFLDRFPGRIVNTHSAPLPEFPGAHPIEDVLAAGVPETAATVHYVDEGIDTGPIIAAERVPVRPGDTVESLRARVQAVEHDLLPRVVAELVSVYDKSGLDEFAQGLVELGVEIVSSGGTSAFLEEMGIPVTRIEEITQVPELLGGRVKTLHPRIHAAILARRDQPEDVSALE